MADNEDPRPEGLEESLEKELEGERPDAPREGAETVPAEESSRDEEPLPPPTPDELADLRKRAAERDEYLELAKRAKADFVNYRRRTEEERRKWAALAQRDLLARLLTACDQCGLAAKSAGEDSSVESLRNAIALVWSELERFLKESGVSAVPTEGARFDPNVHEAVFVQPSAEHPDSTVLSEVKPGYVFGEQVLRPAQVVVTRRPAEEVEEEKREEEREKPPEGLEKEPAEGDNGGDE